MDPLTQSAADKVDPQSPFAKRLNTNYTPTPLEIASINILIDQRQTIVDEIDEEIAELDRRRKELVDRKRPHTEYIDTHRQLISPARRLHPDALLAIFLTLVSAPECDSEKDITRSKVPPAVVISQVCSQWRDLAMRSPSLWSYINLFIPSPPDYPSTTAAQSDWDEHRERLSWWRRSTDRLCAMAESFAERAQDCPLRVSVSANDSRNGPATVEEVRAMQQEYMVRTLSPVGAISHKPNEWKSLRLHLKMTDYTSPFITLMALTKTNNRGLQRLELDVEYPNPGDAPLHIWEAMGGRLDLRKCPLTSLTVRISYSDTRMFDVHWDLLTSLSIGSSNSGASFGPQEAFNILSLTPNLVRCTIDFFDNVRKPFASPQQALSLPHLKELTFLGSPPRLEFAALLDTPSLTHLSAVHSAPSAQDENHSAVVELVRRYGQQLIDVSFAYPSLTQAAFAFVLERLVEVKSLYLYAKEDTPASVSLQIGAVPAAGGREPADLKTHLDMVLLRRLTPRRVEPSTEASVPDCICPKVQTLVCVLGEESGEDVKRGFVDMIEARRKAASAKEGGVGWLEKVEATFYVGPVDKMLGDLEGRGVDTLGVSFKARYAAPHLTPCRYELPIPGVGTINISMDHNHQH